MTVVCSNCGGPLVLDARGQAILAQNIPDMVFSHSDKTICIDLLKHDNARLREQVQALTSQLAGKIEVVGFERGSEWAAAPEVEG